MLTVDQAHRLEIDLEQMVRELLPDHPALKYYGSTWDAIDAYYLALWGRPFSPKRRKMKGGLRVVCPYRLELATSQPRKLNKEGLMPKGVEHWGKCPWCGWRFTWRGETECPACGRGEGSDYVTSSQATLSTQQVDAFDVGKAA